MKAYHIDRFGSVGGIARRSSQDPRPGLKEVLMRVRASSLNYRDLMVLKGGGRGPTKIGVVPLSDGAGEVAAIGEGVTRVKIGDRIVGCIDDEAVWVDESFQAAQQFAYRAPIGAGNGPFTLTNAYKTAAKNEARKRIALAGVRLANMLNDELK